MTINAAGLDARYLNEMIREASDTDITLEGVNGQRFIGCAERTKRLTIHGTAGNGLGGLLSGGTIEVFGNAQDASGDTMDSGTIIIHGTAGDGTGYAMRGGSILIEGAVGYRCGIHMKAYREKQPLIIIGEDAGSFLGEYLAGGTIIVLGLHRATPACPIGNAPGVGMYQGRIIVMGDALPIDLDRRKVKTHLAGEREKTQLSDLLATYCSAFHLDKDALLAHHFSIMEPDSANQYGQLYTYS